MAAALRIMPEDGTIRNLAKRFYAKCLKPKEVDVIFPVLSKDELTKIKDSVKIGFVGDLILLRDMIDAAKTGDTYDFKPMFRHMAPYFSNCDLMTGVLEGPLSGNELNYTTANYEDGRSLHCGYPDEFLRDMRQAGMDFVTIATNHLYDKGLEGMRRTVEVLEAQSMPYVGYGKKARTLIELKGIKIALLAFNYAFIGKKEDFFFEAGNEELPHLIRPTKSKYYKDCLKQVEDDFRWAKQQNPDCIIVYPHIGEQFLHAPDKTQLHWFGIFKKLGADIIFGCHPHATQPLRFEGNCLCLYCPGNFVNNYFPHDGDASAMVEVYLDKSSGKPFAAAIIPIVAYGKHDKLLEAAPMNLLAQQNNLSWHDWFRLKAAHKTVTSSMLGIVIPVENAQDKCIILKDNTYYRSPYYSDQPLWTNKDSLEKLKHFFKAARKAVFIGDSITEGTKNGGYGWFEPLMTLFPQIKFESYAKGSEGIKGILGIVEPVQEQIHGDIFFVAVGCNDIRYRDEHICALTSQQYEEGVRKLIKLIRLKNAQAKIVLIAPWWSDDVFDKCCELNLSAKHHLYDEYTEALKTIAKDEGCIFINPNHMIWEKINSSVQQSYLTDWIHPNATEGIKLFSTSVAEELAKWI